MNNKEYQKEWYRKNREKVLQRVKEYNETRKEEKREYDSKRRELKGDELRAYDRFRQSDPKRLAVKRNWSRKRKMTVKQATPIWQSEFDELFIKEIYHLAVLRSQMLGFEIHVDHIVPLHGKSVCGLHTPNNLQLMEATANIKKKNHFELGEKE